jgi:hypothetical protein
VLVVVALVAVVAIASTGSSVGGSGRTRPPSESLYDTVLTLLYLAAALGGVLLLYGLLQRRQIAQQVATGRYPRSGLITFLLYSVALAAAFYFGLIRVPERGGSSGGGSEGVPGTGLPTLPDEAETSYEPGVSWITIVVIVALVVGAVVAYVVAERRSSRSRRGSDLVLAEQLAQALEIALDDLRAEADPRRAIVAAYARLEQVLAANGVPRVASETADEYLPRVLHDLAIDAEAVGRLTDLFTEAKFSQHEIGPALKEEAIAALEHVRDELRSLHEEAPRAQPPSPAGAAA